MCNLYRMTKTTDEVAKWFDAVNALGGANFAEEVFPGYPGAVVAEGRLQQMTWGFPLVMKGKSGQPLKPKPVNNARTDKLDSFFWRHSFEERRCLIPVTAWAEAQGMKGAMTRTWLSRPDAELFAVAGVWRDSKGHALRAEHWSHPELDGFTYEADFEGQSFCVRASRSARSAAGTLSTDAANRPCAAGEQSR